MKIKIISLLSTSILLTSFCFSQSCGTFSYSSTVGLTETPDCNNNYFLVFEDNFLEDHLDLLKWELQHHAQGTLNGGVSQGYNSLDNIQIINGNLYIIAKKETVIRRTINHCPDECVCDDETDDGTTFDEDIDNCILSDGVPNLRTFYYTTSNIWTRDKFLYGKFEISCKIPEGSFWPSFWLFGCWNSMGAEDTWNEIDVFEFRKGTNDPQTNLQYDVNNDGNTDEADGETCPITFNNLSFDFQTFNTFTLIWDEYSIKWFINGNWIRTVNYYRNTLLQSVGCEEIIIPGVYFKEDVYGFNPMALILNLGIENGDFTPNENDLPAYFVIDYVRIWKKAEPNCCISHKLYEATENLPTLTSVDNYIIAGNDAGIFDAGGNVVVKSGQTVSFKAGDFIDLNSGFEVEKGANFSAVISPCTVTQGDNIEIISFPDSFSPDNDGIDDKLMISVNGATSYKIRVEDKDPPYNTFYQTGEISIFSNSVAVWDGSCNYTGNCWFYHKCDRQRRITLTFYNCDNMLISQKVIDVDCNSKSLIIEEENADNEQGSDKSMNYNNEIENFQIHPNPFSNSFTISFTQPEQTDAKIYLTDAYGRHVLGIFNGSIDKGQHSIDVSTDGITKGLYFCIMETPTNRKVVKVVKTE
jgi:hypothetical protein